MTSLLLVRTGVVILSLPSPDRRPVPGADAFVATRRQPWAGGAAVLAYHPLTACLGSFVSRELRQVCFGVTKRPVS